MSTELTKWDKLFSMLENSQMRENMLLQYADDIIKVEMGSLRAELLRTGVRVGSPWRWRGDGWPSSWRSDCGNPVSASQPPLGFPAEMRPSSNRSCRPLRGQAPSWPKLETSCLAAALGPKDRGRRNGHTGAGGVSACGGGDGHDGEDPHRSAKELQQDEGGAGAGDQVIEAEVPACRMVAQNGGSCGVAVEMAGRRLAQQLEKRLREPRLSLPAATGLPGGNEALLQQVLSAVRGQASKLAKLETSCLAAALGPKTGGDGMGHLEQEVSPPVVAGMAMMERTLIGVLKELQQTRAALEQVTKSSRQRYLPA
ncbi:hypothetical protein CRUP_034787, partial [Coryphaenoides rupestris]